MSLNRFPIPNSQEINPVPNPTDTRGVQSRIDEIRTGNLKLTRCESCGRAWKNCTCGGSSK